MKSDVRAVIRGVLFPPDRWSADGTYLVNSDAIDNLDAAIVDLERTGADAGSIRTLKRVAKQLEDAGGIVGRVK